MDGLHICKDHLDRLLTLWGSGQHQALQSKQLRPSWEVADFPAWKASLDPGSPVPPCPVPASPVPPSPVPSRFVPSALSCAALASAAAIPLDIYEMCFLHLLGFPILKHKMWCTATGCPVATWVGGEVSSGERWGLNSQRPKCPVLLHHGVMKGWHCQLLPY